MLDPAVAALVTDARLSDSAVRMALYLASQGGEWVAMGREDWRRLLFGKVGKNRIAEDLSDLAHYGYIERKLGGRGAADRFRFRVPERGTLNEYGPSEEDAISDKGPSERDAKDRVPAGGTLTPDSVPVGGTLNGAHREEHAHEGARASARPSPPPPSPSPGGRASAGGARQGPAPEADLAQLRGYLGPELADVVDRYQADAPHPANWCSSVYRKYRLPGGTLEHLWSGVPPERAPGAMANALENLLIDRQGVAFAPRLFEAFLVSEIARAKAGPVEAASVQESAPRNGGGYRARAPTALPDEVQSWVERMGARLQEDAGRDPEVAKWAQASTANLRRLHVEDRDFKRMSAEQQEEHLRVRTLKSYAQRVGESVPESVLEHVKRTNT